MTTFEINLIRGQVPAASKRRGMFFAMVAYLLVCGLALGRRGSHQKIMTNLSTRVEFNNYKASYLHL